MKIEPLGYEEVSLPKFPISPDDLSGDIRECNLFDLSSHTRAREAIEFGLKMRPFGAHIFIVGGDQRGRMSSTLNYLEHYIPKLPAPYDWIYLNNFLYAHSPIPFRLPPGKGYRLQTVLKELVDCVHVLFSEIFTSSHYLNQVDSLTETLEVEVNSEMQKLQEFAQSKGLRLENADDEISIVNIHEGTSATSSPENSPAESAEKSYTQRDIQYIRDKIGKITASARIRSRELNQSIQDLKKYEGGIILQALMVTIYEEFKDILHEWIDDLKHDILDHIDDFLNHDHSTELEEAVRNRYSVNLFVDNQERKYPSVIVDPSPSYESLFGSIKYRMGQNGYLTDFTLIRSGNLHKANGGILVLRAEAIAADNELWTALKIVMRDKMVRIEERYRENTMPMLDAPAPQSIPLDIQIVLVGAPQWYYSYFVHDPEFRNYFKVKADIEADLPATPENISICVNLIRHIAQTKLNRDITGETIQYLLGYTSRWANDRKSISSKFEILSDIICESSQYSTSENGPLELIDTLTAIKERRYRNSLLEDRTHRDIEDQVVLIDTQGQRVGSINGLTVLSIGDHEYGVPNRISARTYVGEEGVINIERLTEMGGPIQQKGALILDGFLNGLFSQHHAVCCSCSLTFEQNYSGIEGDSATLGELLAIISSLSKLPARQDIAITGSLNQLGEVQAVGGINHKIEGFFRICQHRGFTGKQGVIIPYSNINNVILRDNVSEAIKNKTFFVWPVKTVEEAIKLIFGINPGTPNKAGKYPEDSVYGRVADQLNNFSRAIDGLKKKK